MLLFRYPYAGLRESQRQDRQEKLLRSVYQVRIFQHIQPQEESKQRNWTTRATKKLCACQALAARAFWGIIEAWRQEWMDKVSRERIRTFYRHLNSPTRPHARTPACMNIRRMRYGLVSGRLQLKGRASERLQLKGACRCRKSWQQSSNISVICLQPPA